MDTENLLADVAAVRAAAYAPDDGRRERARQPPEASLHPRLAALLDRVAQPAEREAVAGAFSGLSRLLDCLAVIKECLDKGAPLEKTLIIFNLINEKAHTLLDFMETQAVGCGDDNEPLADALDGTCFAVRHELRRVFDAGTLKVGGARAGSLTLADVVRAHGLLNNCFEQSVVALAQLFDARVTTVQIFSDYRTKLEQTLSLREELHRLYDLTRYAEEHGALRAYFNLFKALREFRAEQMHNLMYRDWADCEAFVEGITASRNSAELTPLLHQFARYLETLIRQVGMRAVLADHPPDHYSVNDTPATNRPERAGSLA